MVKLSPAGKFWVAYLGFLVVVIYSLLNAVGVFGQALNINAQWNTNTEPDLAGYRIYWTQEQGSYSNAFDVPLVNYLPPPQWNLIQTDWLTSGVWYFVATAYDTSGNESDFSDEATVTIPDVSPNLPKSIKFQVVLPDGTTIDFEVTTP